MENEYKICSECGTRNESVYSYCKNCGAPLGETQNTGEYRQEQRANSGSYHTGATPGGSAFYGQPGQNFYGVDAIDGIPTDDIADYVGKKAPEFLPKFIHLEFSHQKISWLWPPAILAFLLGPIGAALWFFYRKMPKIAAILVAVSLVLTVAETAVVVSVFPGGMSDFAQDVAEDILSLDPQTAENALERLADSLFEVTNAPAVLVMQLLSRIVRIAVTVIVGLFACYWYKGNAVNAIRRYRAANVDPRYYRIGLASVGGTSGGLLALGILIAVFASSIVSSIGFAAIWL